MMKFDDICDFFAGLKAPTSMSSIGYRSPNTEDWDWYHQGTRILTGPSYSVEYLMYSHVVHEFH